MILRPKPLRERLVDPKGRRLFLKGAAAAIAAPSLGFIIDPYRFGVVDPFWSSVKLYLDFSTGSSNGGTTLIDRSTVGRTMTVHGGATTSNVDSAYGTTLCGVFDGTGDNWTAAHSTDFDFGSSDLTVEGTDYSSDTTHLKWLYSNRSASSPDNGVYIFQTSSAHIQCVLASGGTNFVSQVSVGTISSATKFDWALTRVGTTVRFFLNGSLDWTQTSVSTAVGTSDGLCYIGTSSNEDGTRDWNGRSYRRRVTNGVGRYTASYTPAAWLLS